MGSGSSTSTSYWVTVSGWVAIVVLLGWVIRTMKKHAPKGCPELVSEYRETWNRDWTRFPLHADLPRLSRKVFIHTKDGKTLSPPDSPIHAIKQLVHGLAEQLFDWSPMSEHKSETVRLKLEEAFAECTEDSDLQTPVKAFLTENVTLLGPALIGLLKTVTQDIVAPGVVRMKTGLAPQMRYKDVRGEWFIHISFESSEAVLVSHQKREQSFGHEEGQEFQFQWNLDLLFDPSIHTLRASALYIPVLEFGSQATEDTKARTTLLLEEYTRL